MKISERNYGIDLAKIFAMNLVILSHILYPGGVIESIKEIERFVLISPLRELSLCCINIFVLATGYLSIEKDSINTSKIINMILNVLFYSISITLLFILFDQNTFRLYYIFNTIDIGSYWFFKAYIALYLLTPFINKLISNISLRNYRILLIILLIISFLPNDYYHLNSGYSLWWLIIVYLLGGYIRERNFVFKDKYKLYILFVFSIFLLVSFNIIYFKYQISVLGYITAYFNTYTSPLVILNSTILFFIFKDINISRGFSKIIKSISGNIFYVYIIHYQFVVAWELIINKFTFLNSFFIWQEIICIMFITFLIFILCIIIDKVKNWIFKQTGIEKLLNNISYKLNLTIEV